MRYFNKTKQAICALFLTGFIASTGIMGGYAYADQSLIQNAQEASAQAKEKIRQDNLFEINKDDLVGNTDLILSQTGSGRCTLAANAMMLRRAAFLEGREDWEEITEQSLGAKIWSGRGIPNTYEAFGMTVNIQYFERDAEERNEELINLLDQHPEGIAVYDSGVPHALLLICYDEENDEFLCADPAAYYGGQILEVGETWNGKRRGSSQAVLDRLNSYWCVDK